MKIFMFLEKGTCIIHVPLPKYALNKKGTGGGCQRQFSKTE